MNRRQAQLFQLGWVADYPDAENFLQLFYSKIESPGPNHANYKNARFDDLYEIIQTMPDSDERTVWVKQMVDIVIEDAPWIFLYQPMSFGLIQDWVKNYLRMPSLMEWVNTAEWISAEVEAGRVCRQMSQMSRRVNKMWGYIIRRLAQMLPTVIGVVLLTFVLFNIVPNDLAAIALGKNVSAQMLEAFDEQRG